MFTFEIRFPVEGGYKLVIYGGLHQSSKLRLCEFKLNCKKRMQRFNLFPTDGNNIGWGPGPHSEAAGLLVPSKPNGLIPVASPGNRQKVECKFTLDKLFMSRREYSSILLGSDSDGEEKEYPGAVKYEVDGKTRQFTVQATLPSDGEFALMIKSATTTSTTTCDQVDGETVCNYLLSTVAKKPRLKVPQKLAIEKLCEALESEKKPNIRLIDTIERIQESLDKCKKAELDSSNDDVYAGETRLEFLIAKNALRDCELRRHLGVTIRTLERLERYRYKNALKVEWQRVLDLKAELENERLS